MTIRGPHGGKQLLGRQQGRGDEHSRHRQEAQVVEHEEMVFSLGSTNSWEKCFEMPIRPLPPATDEKLVYQWHREMAC